MQKEHKIFVAGHRGLVGSAILNNLRGRGFENIVTRTRKELDLTDQRAVASFFNSVKPDHIFLAAAQVGGIMANNTYRAEFIFNNLMIQSNVIHQSYINKVKKLIFLGSTCIYPKKTEQPMGENSLLTGALEYTNEPYAIAKIAGIKMCESYNLQFGTNFISVMPTNLYGPNDNFDLEKSHVLPALIRKVHLAKLLFENNEEAVLKDLSVSTLDEANEHLVKYGISKGRVEIWGSGKPKREFMWSEDMADACVFVMMNVNFEDTYTLGQLEINNTHINIGTGSDISIRDLAKLVKDVVGYRGELYFNTSKPDGTFRKLVDVTKLHALGWRHSIEFEEGIEKLYRWYLKSSHSNS